MTSTDVLNAGLERLARSVDGTLIRDRDAGYDEARHVFNAMIERRPAAILRCASVSDAALGIKVAREYGLPLSIRGGGHSVAGNAVCDGGLMLDMSGMKRIDIDAQQRIAVTQPGLTLAEFDEATQAHSLATTMGVVSVTGIAGLTLGGGIGWLNGKYGLACDNLLAADVLTAEGELLTADASNNQDLFWGLRGGGGNFGVVTSFTYRLHPVSNVVAGSITYPPEHAASAMRHYHEFAAAAPDEVTTSGGLGRGESGRPVFSATACYCGPPDGAEKALAPLRAFGPVIADTIGPIEYCTLQRGSDGGFPPGRQHYWKAGFLRDLSDDAIGTILDFAGSMPSELSGVGLQQMTGAAARVLPSATAFSHRARQYDFLILSQWQDVSQSERNIEWTRRFFAAMQPYLQHGVYINNLGNEGEERVRSGFGSNYERLVGIKTKYDPGNVFRMNANVSPSS